MNKPIHHSRPIRSNKQILSKQIHPSKQILSKPIDFIKQINTRAKGRLVEDLAVQYLQSSGLIIITRNFYCSSGEIDVICQDKQDLVFVEVRYRKNLDFGSPVDSINYKKQQKIISVARTYLALHKTHYQNNTNDLAFNCRFDVIGINGDLNAPEIEWIQNAFMIW